MELDELRKEIDAIDLEMAHLFERRMEVIARIGELKRKEGRGVYDPSREEFVIERNAKYIGNKAFTPYYRSFMIYCMAVAKKFMRDSGVKHN
jgi:monofunctional chorismate mutase